MSSSTVTAAVQSKPSFEIRPLLIDEYSSLRNLHAQAIKFVLASSLSSEETDVLVAHVRTPEYTTRLMSRNFLIADIGGMHVGSIAWAATPECEGCARISGHFVHPMFGGIGIGRALLEAALEEVAAKGFQRILVRVPLNAVSLYETAGFCVASQGVTQDFAPGTAIHVAFMRRG